MGPESDRGQNINIQEDSLYVDPENTTDGHGSITAREQDPFIAAATPIGIRDSLTFQSSKQSPTNKKFYVNSPFFHNEDKYDEFMESIYLKYPKNQNLKITKVKKHIDVYSDDTIITGSTTWGEIKENAMKQPDYLEKNPFAMYLTAEEKELLKKCIAAQKIQGNMSELKIKSEKVTHFMKKRKFRNSINPTLVSEQP